MRDSQHFRQMMDGNPGAAWGASLAAAAIYAARYGACEAEHHGSAEFRDLVLDLQARYGETLTTAEVRAEVDAELDGEGWRMAGILAELRAQGLTGMELIEAAHGRAAELEAAGAPMREDPELADMGDKLRALVGPDPELAELDTLTLTTAHSASNYGVPVLVIGGGGDAYGPGDMTPAGVIGAELVRSWAARYIGATAAGRLDLARLFEAASYAVEARAAGMQTDNADPADDPTP